MKRTALLLLGLFVLVNTISTATSNENEFSSTLRDLSEEFCLGNPCNEKDSFYSDVAQQSIKKIIQYINDNHRGKREEITAILLDSFKELGSDIDVILITPLLEAVQDNSELYKVILSLCIDAMKYSFPEVHESTARTFFKYCDPEQKEIIAISLAQSADPVIGQMPPRLIRQIALISDSAAIILSHAALREQESVNRMCIHTIPMLASINIETKKIFESIQISASALDLYLLNEHSGGAGICMQCKGFCRFKEDILNENIAKLIKGIRTICDICSTNYDIAHIVKNIGKNRDPQELALLSLPEAQNIYCVKYSLFLHEGEYNAKLHHLYMQEQGEAGLLNENHNDYLFAKTLNYKEDDIKFFYVRCAKIDRKPEEDALKQFAHDKERGDAWLQQAHEKVVKIKDWNPKKFIDLVCDADNRSN